MDIFSMRILRTFIIGAAIAGFATQTPSLYAQNEVIDMRSETAPVPQIKTTPERALKWKVAIGRFSNETQYGKGIFYDRENDPMAKQALDILSSKLASSGKFLLLERDDLDLVEKEVEAGTVSQKIGADFIILGSITEFGRKTVGKEGLFTAEKIQAVEAGVSMRMVDVATGQIIFSDEAKGIAETSSKSTLGFGDKAGFDATLSDKAISGAFDQLVENMIKKVSDRPWRTYFISADADGVVIAGGPSQGVLVGDVFAVLTKGKKVKNPQTGAMLELPGKKVGSVTIVYTGGEDPLNEFSIVEVQGLTLSEDKLNDYVIQSE